MDYQQPPNQPQQPMQGQYPQQPPPGYQFQPPQGPYMPPPRKSHKGLWIALAIGLVVIIAVCSIAGMVASSAPKSVTTTAVSTSSSPAQPAKVGGKWTTTHTFSGSGAKKTAILTVPDDWKLVYSCQGISAGGITTDANLIVTVYGSDGSVQDIAVNALCKAGKTTSDTTEEHQGGQVYLDVNADSAWTLKVMELK